MKFLILTALLAVGSCVPLQRTRRSFQHYAASPQLYGNQQYYTSQAVSSPVYSEVSPQLYSAEISPALYGSRTLSQESLYRVPSSSSYYPSQTYSSYAAVPRVQYNVQASPAHSQVSAPALYNAEHTEHASSSSHYRLQAPATVTYAQPSSAQYVQQAQYVAQPSSAQYVQQPAQYVAQPTWQQGTWTGNNPWC